MNTIYPEAFIYKISNSDGSKFYYGSTNNIKQRIYDHNSNYKLYCAGKLKCPQRSALQVLIGGNYKFEVLEQFKDISKLDLHKKESEYILNNECVNKQKFYGENKKRDYRKQNEEKLKAKQRDYYKKNRERIAERVVCDCGKTVSRGFLAKHKRTKNHKDFEARKQINITINITGSNNTVNINN